MEVLNVQSTWYPMRLSSIYREKIWGGTQIPRLRGEFSDRCIGESWDIACRSDSDNRVANGRFAGELFRTLAKRQGKALLGDGWSAASFPLLVKLIDAREPLSVQVHPDDGYAGRVEGCSGKTEMWYVLDAQPGACLIAGVRSCTKAELRDAVLAGRAEQYLNRIEVHRGDSITIPSGMVHALGAGCLVVEIQQNSDVTYRLFDYGRRANCNWSVRWMWWISACSRRSIRPVETTKRTGPCPCAIMRISGWIASTFAAVGAFRPARAVSAPLPASAGRGC